MIQKIKLTDFRNFKDRTLDFSEKITVIVGPNASGKTNILESLFLLSTGKSFKAKVEVEMLRYEQELARVSGVASSTRDVVSTTKLEAVITKGDNGWPRKKLMVNGVSRRLVDFAGNFKVVLFGPWDMDLVTESPSIRRKFLDTVLSQVDREYRRNILSYEKGLRQRNKVLWRLREDPSTPFGRSGRSMLAFWNQLLIKNGDYISRKREEFINFANSQPSLNKQKFRIEYDRSVISEGRLEQYANEEVASATTLVGPHRDDFIFFDNERNLTSFGSRGEQRMAVLWLKMSELDYVEERTRSGLDQDRILQEDARPTLLLDDIFSELDHVHRDIVMTLSDRQQTIITTADEHFIVDGVSGKIET